MSDLDRFEVPVERALSSVVSIFKGKTGIRNCSYYRAMKLHQHGMKVIDTVSQKRLCRIVLSIKCNLTLCLRKDQLILS